MKKEEFTTIILESEEGMILTDENRSFFSKKIYLGRNDSPDNYIEVSESEVPESEIIL